MTVNVYSHGFYAATFYPHLSKIKKSTPHHVLYRYVPTEDNPANIGSRGSTFEELHNSIWWSGPPWLSQAHDSWPDTDLHLKDNTDDLDSLQHEPIFYTLAYSLHTYNKLPSTLLYHTPLNNHSYIHTRKTKFKKKLLQHISLSFAAKLKKKSHFRTSLKTQFSLWQLAFENLDIYTSISCICGTTATKTLLQIHSTSYKYYM